MAHDSHCRLLSLVSAPLSCSFGKPSGLSARLLCGSTAAFVLLRVGLFFFWLGVMIWSMVDWVNTSAWVPIDRDDSSPECADGVAGCEQVRLPMGVTHFTQTPRRNRDHSLTHSA
uniref:Uncharacterized protein n=1 Tax=Emiliania huxleyi TaxID=2903 RepID=A0A7S3TH27_EMIHU